MFRLDRINFYGEKEAAGAGPDHVIYFIGPAACNSELGIFDLNGVSVKDSGRFTANE